jgi:hypothetical protein
MEWARNRSSLWNSVENAESRKNARVAREIQVNLPHELPPERRVALARTFSQEVADHYKVAVDLAVHEPRPSGDPRNHHAHLLMTTREVSAEGLGAKAALELSRHERVRLGLPSSSQEFTAIRERWATITNEALKEANIEARVDHRSLAEQGIDREPRPHIPFAAYKIERAGQRSDVAESIRADYAARVQARLERQATREPNEPRPQQPAAALQQPSASTPQHPNLPTPQQSNEPALQQLNRPTPQQPNAPALASKSLEDIRREARENWLKLRAAQHADQAPPTPSQAQPGHNQPAPSRDQPTPSRGRALPSNSAGAANEHQPAARQPAAATPTLPRAPDHDQTL